VSRNWRLFLADMISAAEEILEETGSITREEFDARRTVRKSVMLSFIVLGEAAKQIPDEIRARYPNVDWKGMAGFRDVITHSYFRVDYKVMWDIARNEVPGIREELAHIASAEAPPAPPVE
jgi:uncharacterized protein with HEPN domain